MEAYSPDATPAEQEKFSGNKEKTMSAFLNINTAISALDKPTSLIPFWVKDGFDIAGRTAMANKEGGKHEAREKFIEEAGTSLFWIGGIPAIRGICNKFVNSKGILDPDIHFNRINSDGIQSYFADSITKSGQNKFSKNDLQGIVLGGQKLTTIKNKLKEAGDLSKSTNGKYKKYHNRMTMAAVLINLFMLVVVLPKGNQLLSKKIIKKEVTQEKDKKNKNIQFLQKKHKKFNPSFGSLKEFFDFKNLLNFEQMAEKAQLNVTSSMLVLDYGISGSRVTFVPRNNNERVEYAVKEGGIILFFYYAADWIKKGFSLLANKAFKTPIDLDYKIIKSKEFAQKLKDSPDKNKLLEFAGDKTDELNVIKFIDKELAKVKQTTDKEKVFDNLTLKMAQETGLVDVEYDDSIGKWIRHSKKYIETDKVVELNKNLKYFYEQGIKNNTKNIDNVLTKTKYAKALSVLGNIAICCASLSYFLPKIQYKIREKRTKTNSAPGIKHYQDLAKRNMI